MAEVTKVRESDWGTKYLVLELTRNLPIAGLPKWTRAGAGKPDKLPRS